MCNKIGVSLRNLNRNTKPEWEIRLEGLAKKLRKQAKMLRKKKNKTKKKKHSKICWDEETKTKQQTSSTNKKSIGKKMETQKIQVQDQTIQTKQDLPKLRKKFY